MTVGANTARNVLRFAAGQTANPQGSAVSKPSRQSARPEPQPADLADAALVVSAAAGRPASFDQLIERHQKKAVSIAYRLLGDLNDALEVCQEAFLRAYRNLATLEDPARFRPWLLRIVTNLALNFRRDRAVGGPKRSLDEFVREPGQTIADGLADNDASDERPGAGLAAEELRGALAAALDELPDKQRAALVLFSLEQLPQKEVAEMMGCSVEAVKWHVFQARRKLRARLADFL